MIRRDERGESIVEVLVSVVVLGLMGLVVVNATGAYGFGTETTTAADNAVVVGENALQAETALGCGTPVGTESNATLSALAVACPNGLGTFQKAETVHYGNLTYHVNYTSAWVDSSDPTPSSCFSYSGLVPNEILESVRVSWSAANASESRTVTAIQSIPPDSLATHISNPGAIVVGVSQPGSPGGTPGGEATLVTPGEAKITRSAAANACVWFPFLPAGSTWAVTDSLGSQTGITVAANQTVAVSP